MIITTSDAVIQPLPQPCISLDDMLLRLTQIFRFAERLAKKTTRDGEVDMSVRLAGIGNRRLHIEDSLERFQYYSNETELFNSWHCSPAALKNFDALAIKAALWFCERFNWDYVNEALLTNIQKKFVGQM